MNAPLESPYDGGLHDFLYVLFKRKILVVFLFFTVLGSVLFATYLTTPLYHAATKVWIQKNPKQQIRIFPGNEMPQMSLSLFAPTNNIVQVATGEEIALNLVRRHSLDERLRRKVEAPEGFREEYMYWFKKVLKAPIRLIKWPLIELGILTEEEKAWEAMAVEHFLDKSLDVMAEGLETEVVSIGVWLDDPDLGARIANDITDEVVERLRDFETGDADDYFQFVEQRLGPVERRLRETEAAVSDFKKQTNVVLLDEEKKLKLSQFNKLHMDRTETLSNLALFESRGAIAKRELGSQREKFGSLELYRDLERKVLEYEQTAESFRAKLAVLDKELEQVNADLVYLNEVEYELSTLERDRDMQLKIYNNLRSKYEELDIQRIKQKSEFELQVIDRAAFVPGAEADFPDWTVNLIAGVVLALAAALVMPFLVEFWDDSFKDGAQLEQKLGLRVLASVREYPTTL